MRLILAEDSVLLREGLASLLQDAGHEVVAAVGDAPALIEAVAAHRPDVAVVDVRMPPAHTDDGLRAALRIRESWPEVGVLVLSQYVDRTYAAQLLAGSGGREREVLHRLAQGYANGAIADDLHVSLSTVEKHIQAIFDKLELPATPAYSRRVLAILRYLND